MITVNGCTWSARLLALLVTAAALPSLVLAGITGETTGPLIQWGGTLTNEQANQPSPAEQFMAVASGAAHSLALRPDGSLVQWGDNEVNQRANQPAASERFVRIAAGLYHSIALRADGSLVQWGNSSLGQAGGMPAASDRFVAISAGAYHSVGLRADGTIKQWGGTLNGQILNFPASSERFIAVSCGAFHTIALRADGTLVQWGATSQGQANSKPAATERFTKISAGKLHNLALRADGSLAQWGSSAIEQMNNAPGSGERFSDISAGYYHSLALRLDGTLVQWGAAGDEQRVGTPSSSIRLLSISAGTFHNLAISGGAVQIDPASAMTFTYQGRLSGNSGPVDLRFSLFDNANDGQTIGQVRTITNVAPNADGLFIVPVNFGDNVEFGGERFVQIEVCEAGTGAFERLYPRQRLTATPKAVRAEYAGVAANAVLADTASVAGSVPWSGVTGVPSNISLAPWNSIAGGIAYTGSGNVGIGTSTPTQKLTVNGSVLATNIAAPSSRRLKQNVQPMKNALEAAIALEPVWFDWIATEAKSRGFTRDFGFIAEEVQKVFPEVVFSDENGQVVGMDYARLSAVSICAVKELHATIQDQRDQIDRLERQADAAREENDDLRARLERLEAMMSSAR